MTCDPPAPGVPGGLMAAEIAEQPDVWQRLLDRSVLVRNCASWPRLDGCLRITLGTPGEYDRFLDALTDILETP